MQRQIPFGPLVQPPHIPQPHSTPLTATQPQTAATTHFSHQAVYMMFAPLPPHPGRELKPLPYACSLPPQVQRSTFSGALTSEQPPTQLHTLTHPELVLDAGWAHCPPHHTTPARNTTQSCPAPKAFMRPARKRNWYLIAQLAQHSHPNHGAVASRQLEVRAGEYTSKVLCCCNQHAHSVVGAPIDAALSAPRVHKTNNSCPWSGCL